MQRFEDDTNIVDICIFVFQGEQLLLTWQRAGHTEDSLRRLLHQEQPETQSALQLLLVKVSSLILTFAEKSSHNGLIFIYASV